MKDPYKTLGVTEDATDDEIRRAYLTLCDQYSPDKYSDSPLSDIAGDRLQEIENAFSDICNLRSVTVDESKAKAEDATVDRAPYSGMFPEASALLEKNNSIEAEKVLNAVPKEKRTAEWNYLMGLTYAKRGWRTQANHFFLQAHELDPKNKEYAKMMKSPDHRGDNHSQDPKNKKESPYLKSDSHCDSCCGFSGECCECLGPCFFELLLECICDSC